MICSRSFSVSVSTTLDRWPGRVTFGGAVGSTCVESAACVVERTTALSARDDTDLRLLFSNPSCCGVPGESASLPFNGNSGVVNVDGPASPPVASRLDDRSALPFTSDDRPFNNLLIRLGRERSRRSTRPCATVAPIRRLLKRDRRGGRVDPTPGIGAAVAPPASVRPEHVLRDPSGREQEVARGLELATQAVQVDVEQPPLPFAHLAGDDHR